DPADLAAALFPDERRLSGPPGQVEEVTSPALPSPALPQGLPSPQADFRHGTSSQTSSMNDSEDAPSERSVHSTVRTDRRMSAVRPMNSLEILPNYLNVQDLSREPLPLYRRVADALAKPFRCWRAPPGRSPHPARKTVTKVRPSLRTGGSTNLEAKMAIKAQGRLARRTAVVLQASEMEKLKSKAWWRCGRKADWPFADPSGRPRQCWDMVASALLCLQLLYLPFQAAFVSNTDFQDPAFFTINVCLLAMDIFWTADLLLNFTTGYRDAVQVLHCDFRSTSAHYLRSWFPVDLLATVPALLLHLLVLDGQIRRDESHLWPLRWLGFSPFLRTPRLWRAFHMLRRLEANLKSSLVSSVVALVQLVMLPIIFSHISACALWYLGRSNLESDATTSSWIKLGLDISDAPGALQAVSVGERYMTAMYFAITVMSTVGLGDINMNLSNERALLCVIMATTSLVVGVAVNGVATIVSKLSERTAVTNEQLAKVSRFLRVYSVPGDLQSRVHNYLLQFFENQEREETKSMLMKWLIKSEVLRVNVNMALTGTCLATHHLLQLVPADILVDICDICDMEFHPPGQELILEGAEVKSCFYIRRGLVQTRRNIGKVDSSKLSRAMTTKSLAFAGPGEEMEDSLEIQKEVEAVEAARPDAQLHGGSFLGDVRLFLGASRSWKTVTCSSFCELISIDVEKFRSLMVSHLPELFDVLVIYSAIDNHCPKALQRCLEDKFDSDAVAAMQMAAWCTAKGDDNGTTAAAAATTTTTTTRTTSTIDMVQWFIYSQFDGTTTCEAAGFQHQSEMYPAGHCVDRSTDDTNASAIVTVNSTALKADSYSSSNCSGSITDTIYRLSSSCQPEGNQSYQMSDDTNAGVIDMRACIDGQWGTRQMLLPLDTCIMLSGVNSYPGKLSCVSGQLRVIPFDDAACSMATANADAIVENLTFAVPGTCKMVMLPFGELSVPLLFGEASVSQCRPNPARLAAKTQRATALDFLIEQLGADVSVLDQEDATDDTPNRVQEKTPAQVAAKLKHKEVFWAVIKHGSIVTDQDVLPKEAQSIRNRTKRGVQVLSSGSLEAEGDEKNWTPSELRERLQQSGLNLGLYGHEGGPMQGAHLCILFAWSTPSLGKR
ncbi:KCNH2, partial [Symbiodinium microadriaticum]